MSVAKRRPIMDARISSWRSSSLVRLLGALADERLDQQRARDAQHLLQIGRELGELALRGASCRVDALPRAPHRKRDQRNQHESDQVRRQSKANISPSVVPATSAFLTTPKTLSATTFSMSLTSLPIRDMTSPARLCV